MSSIGIALPLLRSSNDGFEMLKTLEQTAKQNLKMIILTNPGERIMDPNFGVGIKTYLFSNFNEGVQSEIYDRILKQVATYLPAVKITNITFLDSDPDTATLSFQVYYRIATTGIDDLLQFTI